MYGAVSSVTILRDEVTLVSKGAAFVRFATPAAAASAASRMNGALVYGRPVCAVVASSDSTRNDLSTKDTDGQESNTTNRSGYILAGHGPFGKPANAGGFAGHQAAGGPLHAGFQPDLHAPWNNAAASLTDCAAVPGMVMPHGAWSMPQGGLGPEAQVLQAPASNGVNINGTVFFEAPSPNELPQCQGAPWMGYDPHAAPCGGWT
jgi:RNA recognition motif. (a.k.a. RRM, RBD, or RNP domain)